MKEINLTWAEMLLAANVGVMRNVQNLKLGQGRIDGQARQLGGMDYTQARQFGGMDYTWSTHIEGAAGEMAVAKYLGRFWSGAIGFIKADDVGPYQVKTNTSRKWDDLILREWNDPAKIYISVLSFVPKFVIAGWVLGSEGMKKEFHREGTPGMPAYFVPRLSLHPMSDLPALVDANAP
jgi:hypothetical protein